MGFYWNIMMYECKVEYKGYFFSCFSIFNERYFTFANLFKAFAPPPRELNLATPTHAAGSDVCWHFVWKPLPSMPPPAPLLVTFRSRSDKIPNQRANCLCVFLRAGRGTVW